MFFRRKRRGKQGGKHAADKNGDRVTVEELVSDSDERELPAHNGPYDADDVPDDEIDRLDLGSLRIPKIAGTEIRLEADKSGQLAGALVVHERSGAHLIAFAAPKSETVWDEIRHDLRVNLERDGASPREVAGEFGVELWAKVSTPQGVQPMRFVGIDGPRWLLRVIFSGRAGDDPAASTTLMKVVRDTIVVRGDSPLPVRDQLPLMLPKELAEQAAKQAESASADSSVEEVETRHSKYAVPTRGTQISEIR